jgi:hypothetical protein
MLELLRLVIEIGVKKPISNDLAVSTSTWQVNINTIDRACEFVVIQ